ncbi:MAG: hypothetical protein GXO00_00750 [Candidatus Diapherotrites archaeon]|nr:hypothetical protein [Candidatus Diapherotrites archaeon]
MKGYLIRYRYKGSRPSSSYSYQRFFRALYGYTQVVTKSNGRTYVYYREGVLTLYPYIREGRNTVIIPPSALTDVIDFFKTGRNPAHSFEDLSNWDVSYYVEEVNVDPGSALKAIYSALNRILVRVPEGFVPLRELVSKPVLSPDELAALRQKARKIVETEWFRLLKDEDPLLQELHRKFSLALQTLG